MNMHDNGDSSFSNSGPKMWTQCTQPGLSSAVFKRHLKSYLFNAV